MATFTLENTELGGAGAVDLLTGFFAKTIDRIAGSDVLHGTHLAADVYTAQTLQHGEVAPEAAEALHQKAIEAEDAGKILVPALQATGEDIGTYFKWFSITGGIVALALVGGVIYFRKDIISAVNAVAKLKGGI